MHQTAIAHPALAEPPLAESLREWTAAWKHGEALGQRIERELVFTSAGDSSTPSSTWHGWPGEAITSPALAHPPLTVARAEAA